MTTPGAIPPRPATPGVGPTPLTRRAAFLASHPVRIARVGWAWKRTILFAVGTTYGLYNYQVQRKKAGIRDAIDDKTYLLWKVYDGGIVEAKSTGSTLNYLLNSSQGGSPDEPPRVMTLFDVIRTLKFIEADDRIHGIIADFSSTSVPSVPSYSLGLAQIEEIQDALLELRRSKREKFGADGWRSVAWTDSFSSQGQYLFATAFDEVYTQPTGGVPLVGLGSTMPFYGRLAKWLGIEIHAEARNEYKSFVQPYIDEKLTKPQRENREELLNDLNDNMMTYIARNRFPLHLGRAGLDKVKAMSQIGPFTALTATALGLLNGTNYRQDILDSVLEKEKGGDPDRKLKGFYHYHKVVEKVMEKSDDNVLVDVGVVYLMGAIGESGEFGTAAVVRGLKEAAEDPKIGAVVLRIDSGGGGVVESDTIWGAVRDLREKHGKTIVASFGNASASGGYLVSTHVDAILAGPSTITGSIGVASLRPTILKSFFDRIHLTVESFFTGSAALDPTHRLTPEELSRGAAQVDEMYDDFKNRVCTGRGIHSELIDLIAGGRVMTGMSAFSLTAPKELISMLKGMDVVPEATISEILVATPGEVIMASPSEKGDARVATISPDQDTSPFAPPAEAALPSDSTTLLVASDAAVTTLATITDTGVTESAVEATSKASGSVAGALSGTYEVEVGPFGRGLIDGIGGIRDSAIYAYELYLTKSVAELKADNSEMSEVDAIRSLLPDAIIGTGPEGQTLMQMDVRLKRCPAQKSFWQQLSEANRRGDAIDANMITQYVKAQAATWLITLAAGMLSAEMEELGLGDMRKNMGLGSNAKKSWMRAEWAGMNLK